MAAAAGRAGPGGVSAPGVWTLTARPVLPLSCRGPRPGRLQHADAAHLHPAAPHAGLRAASGLPQPEPGLRGAALAPRRDSRHPPGAVPLRRAAEDSLSEGPCIAGPGCCRAGQWRCQAHLQRSLLCPLPLSDGQAPWVRWLSQGSCVESSLSTIVYICLSRISRATQRKVSRS